MFPLYKYAKYYFVYFCRFVYNFTMISKRTVSSIVYCTSYEIFVDHKEIKIFFILKELNSIERNL